MNRPVITQRLIYISYSGTSTGWFRVVRAIARPVRSMCERPRRLNRSKVAHRPGTALALCEQYKNISDHQNLALQLVFGELLLLLRSNASKNEYMHGHNSFS